MKTTKIKIPVAINDRGVVISGNTVTNSSSSFSEDLERHIFLDSLDLQIEKLGHSPSKIYWVEAEIPHSDFETIEADKISKDE